MVFYSKPIWARTERRQGIRLADRMHLSIFYGMRRLPMITIGLAVFGLSSLACQALSSLLPEPTPTPTDVPTRTPVPTQTPTPTPIPSATHTPAPHSFTQNNADGSQTFVDVENGYSITFPGGWNVFEFTESAIDTILDEVAELMPGLDDSVDLSGLISEGMRIAALPSDLDLMNAQTPANMNVVIVDWPANLSMDFVLNLNAQTLPQIFESAEVLSVDQTTNAMGMEQGSIAYIVELPEIGDTLFGYAAIYRIGDSMVTVTGGVSADLQDELAPIFAQVFDSVTRLEN